MARNALDGYEFDQEEIYKTWRQQRVANIHEHVTAADVLSRNNVDLRRHGDQEEQISCPFHGEDVKPSARYFPESGDSRSHVWCYVCRENWDAIGLWQKFSGAAKFTEALHEVERAFHLTVPESGIKAKGKPENTELKEEVLSLFKKCEDMLRMERNTLLMTTHLRFGAILDQLWFGLEKSLMPLEDLRARLRQVIVKIGEKVRAKESSDPQP